MATLLIADDSRPFCEAVGAFMHIRGYEVLCVSNGEQALRLLRDQPVDCLILDLLMPKMGGSDLLAAVRADPQLAGLPVVVVTASTDSADERRMRPFVQAWLLKSAVSLSQLADCIAQRVAAARGPAPFARRPGPALGGVPAPLPPGSAAT